MKKYLTLQNLGWLLIFISAFMLGSASIGKLISSAEAVGNFQFMKLSDYTLAIGLLEFFLAVGLIFPKLSDYAVVGITAVMSGAVAIHLSMMGGAGVLNPILVSLLAWSGHCLRKYTN
jgi:hypothetical protein